MVVHSCSCSGFVNITWSSTQEKHPVYAECDGHPCIRYARDYRGLERNFITADRNGHRADRLLGVIEENRESMVAGRGIPALLADTRPALIRRRPALAATSAGRRSDVVPHCLQRRSALFASSVRTASDSCPFCLRHRSALLATLVRTVCDIGATSVRTASAGEAGASSAGIPLSATIGVSTFARVPD